MATDHEQLARYALDGDEAAFAEVVQRHLPHVYAAALRQTADHALAQDVVQSVFHDLARKALKLQHEVVLAAWLHRATRFAARDLLRRRHRQAQREQTAFIMDSLQRQSPEPPWEEIQTWLDEALDELPAADREALCARFLQQQKLAEVASSLGVSPDAARKRVDRALDRLRDLLAQRGVNTTAAVLGQAVLAHAAPPLPASLAGLAASITASAHTASTWSIAALMSSSSLKSAAALVAAALLVGLPILHQESLIAAATPVTSHLNPAPLASAANPAPTSDRSPSGAPDHAGEMSRLALENGELRRQLQLISDQLQAAARTAPAGSHLLGTRQRIAELVDSGLGTPEDAFRTSLAAARDGETNRLAATWTWPADIDQGRLDVYLRAASASKPRGLAADMRTGAAAELVIHRTEDAGPGDRWLVYQLILADGTAGPPFQVRMRQRDGSWRIVLLPSGDTDQHAVTPGSRPE